MCLLLLAFFGRAPLCKVRVLLGHSGEFVTAYPAPPVPVRAVGRTSTGQGASVVGAMTIDGPRVASVMVGLHEERSQRVGPRDTQWRRAGQDMSPVAAQGDSALRQPNSCEV